jgi:hypothetical protein
MTKGPYVPFLSKREKCFRMPKPAFMIWMFHYKHEAKDRRESWPSIENICDKCDMNESTVLKYRKWLVDNKWLVPIGFVPSRHGHFSVPKFRVEEGTVPENITDGRGSNRPRRNQDRSVMNGSGSDRPGGIRTEAVSSLKQCQTEPVTPNPEQVSNQAIKEPSAPENFFEEENLRESEVGTTNKTPESDMDIYFPRTPMTPENIQMFGEIEAKLDEESVNLIDVMSFNFNHKDADSKLRLHTLRQAWKAIVHGSPENGVVVQYKTHHEDTCRLCIRKKKEREKNAPPTTSLRPTQPGKSVKRPPDDGKSLWTFQPDGDGGFNRVLRRKPETEDERRELISQRGTLGSNGKPVKWDYFAKYLVQAKCPKCHGKSLECPCVMNEELL